MQKKGIKIEMGLAQDAKTNAAKINETLKELPKVKIDALAAINELNYWRSALIGHMKNAEKVMFDFERALESLDIDPKTNKDYQQLFDTINKGVAVAQKAMTRIDTASENIKQIN